MVGFFVILIAVFVIIYMLKNKIVLRVDTFFRKGFKKYDDNYGIYCFCGKQGDGKTYSVVDFMSEIYGNRKVITNVESLLQLQDRTCLFKGYSCSLSNYLNFNDKDKENISLIYESDFEKIYDFLKTLSPEQCENYIVFYDELFTLIEKGKLDKDMLSFISQMRKRHLYLFTTVQEWLELNVTFRRYVRFQVQCSMFNFKPFGFALSINKVNDAYQMKWDNLQNEYVCPILKTTIKKCSKKVADSYDTFEVIKTQGNLVKKSFSR